MLSATHTHTHTHTHMHAHITYTSELVKQLRLPQQLVSVLYTNVQSVVSVHGFCSSCDLHTTESLSPQCSKQWYTHAHTTLSSTLPPNSAITGYATQGALLISARLSARIAPTSLTLSAPSLQFVKRMSTKAVEVTQQQQQRSSRRTNHKSM